jgi:zinc D-Ala-D-Ala carboxypeptidase
MQTDLQLSPNFLLSEFTASSAAARSGLRNEPNSYQLDNLRRLANKLQTLRTVVLHGNAISILSGLRVELVNAIVGGAPNSQHKEGLAADFICPAFGTPRQIVQAIIDSGVAFDQLIYEGTWVHISIAAVGAMPRNEVLTAVFEAGKPTRYMKGLV